MHIITKKISNRIQICNMSGQINGKGRYGPTGMKGFVWMRAWRDLHWDKTVWPNVHCTHNPPSQVFMLVCFNFTCRVHHSSTVKCENKGYELCGMKVDLWECELCVNFACGVHHSSTVKCENKGYMWDEGGSVRMRALWDLLGDKTTTAQPSVSPQSFKNTKYHKFTNRHQIFTPVKSCPL